MNRLWVASSFVVLFAVLLATGLSVAFLYRDSKKDGKSKDSKDKPSEPKKPFSLLLHLPESEAELKGLPKVWTLDLTATSNYEVSGTKVTVTSTTNSFFDEKKTLTGNVHKFSEPVLVSTFESEKTVVPKDYVELSGLTVFFEKNKPYFYTVWHDGDYHHYSTDLSELCVGDFPYRNEDTKNPTDLALPEGVVKKREEPAPTPVPGPTPDPSPQPSPEPSPDSTPLPVEPKSIVDEDKHELLEKVHVDLDLLATAEDNHGYSSGQNSVKVEKRDFGLYTKWVYTFFDFSSPQAPIFCPPVLKYQDELVELPTKKGTNELSCYTDSLGLPLLVSYKDDGVDYTWVHKGSHRWDRSDKVVVTAQFLDDLYTQILPLVSYDFSFTEQYKSGSYEVKVTEDKELSKTLGTEFVCYSHEPTYPLSEPKVKTKVHHFRVKGVLLEGLPKETHIKKATSCFWRGNLHRPLVLVLVHETKKTYHYGFPKYDEEDNEHMLSKRAELVNIKVNRAVKLDFTNFESYTHTLRTRTLEPYYVSVESYADTPLPRFLKSVHTFYYENSPSKFFLSGIKGATLDAVSLELSSVEAYFVGNERELPVMVNLNGSSDNFLELVHVKDGSHVEYRFQKGRTVKSFDFTLQLLAHKLHNYVTLDLLKTEDYQFHGGDYEPHGINTLLKLEVTENTPRAPFRKVTQTLKEGDKTLPLKILYLRGGDFEPPTDQITKVESYFSPNHMNSPLAVSFSGVNSHYVFVWAPLGYKQLDHKIDDLTADKLELVSFVRFRTVTLQLRSKSDYYMSPYSDPYRVYVKVEELQGGPGFGKYRHTFRPTKDVSFCSGDHHFTPENVTESPYDFTSAIVLTYGDDSFVTLIDQKAQCKSWKFVDGKWSEAVSGDGSVFPVRSLRSQS